MSKAKYLENSNINLQIPMVIKNVFDPRKSFHLSFLCRNWQSQRFYVDYYILDSCIIQVNRSLNDLHLLLLSLRRFNVNKLTFGIFCFTIYTVIWIINIERLFKYVLIFQRLQLFIFIKLNPRSLTLMHFFMLKNSSSYLLQYPIKSINSNIRGESIFGSPNSLNLLPVKI